MNTEWEDATDHQRGYTEAFRDLATLWSSLREEYGDNESGLISHFDSFILAASAKMAGLGDDVAKSFLNRI